LVRDRGKTISFLFLIFIDSAHYSKEYVSFADRKFKIRDQSMENVAVQNFKSRKKIGKFTVEDRASIHSDKDKDNYQPMEKVFELKRDDGGSIEQSPKDEQGSKTELVIEEPTKATFAYPVDKHGPPQRSKLKKVSTFYEEHVLNDAPINLIPPPKEGFDKKNFTNKMSTIKESLESNRLVQNQSDNSKGSKTSKGIQNPKERKNSSFSKSPREETEKESKPSKGTGSPEPGAKINIRHMFKEDNGILTNKIDTPKSNISKPMTITSVISKHEIPSQINFKKDNFTSSFIKEFNPAG
jgi:hypothetical protein